MLISFLFAVSISPSARKSSKKLPEHSKRRIVEFLFVLRENPVPVESYDIAKMKGYVNTFRARIGDIRIVYEIQWNQRAINVLTIKSRENVYE